MSKKRSLYARRGRIFMDGVWAANVTEVTASNGSGEATVDTVSGDIEARVQKFINGEADAPKEWKIVLYLNDTGRDEESEQAVLTDTRFWSLPIEGHRNAATRKLEFTYKDVEHE